MVIAGAGGHGLEVSFILKESGILPSEIYYFDEDEVKSRNNNKNSLILGVEGLKNQLKLDSRFVLGVGNPAHREKLYQLLTALGGRAFSIRSVSLLKSTNFSG